MRKYKSAPSKRELEKNIARLRKVSSHIGQLSSRDDSNPLPAEEVKEQILTRLAEQALIVDRFIGLCRDVELLRRFTEIVNCIETKVRLMESSDDGTERSRLKKEVFHHMEEWINCLELIITGVISQTP